MDPWLTEINVFVFILVGEGKTVQGNLLWKSVAVGSKPLESLLSIIIPFEQWRIIIRNYVCTVPFSSKTQ